MVMVLELCSIVFDNPVLGVLLSMAVTGVYLWHHMRSRPYQYRFQNQIEIYLSASVLIVLAFSLIYTVVESETVAWIIVLVMLGSQAAVLAAFLREIWYGGWRFWSPDFPSWDPKLLEKEEDKEEKEEEEDNAVEMSDIATVPLV